MADRIGVFQNSCYFCNAIHGVAYIFISESVSLILDRKSGKFQCTEDR